MPARPRLGPSIEAVLGGDDLAELSSRGTTRLLRSTRGGRDVAVLHQPAPGRDVVEEADRLLWLDGRGSAPELVASGRGADGDEAAVIRLFAAAVAVSDPLLPVPPEDVVTSIGAALRLLHEEPAEAVPFDAVWSTLRRRAADRVGGGHVGSSVDGPYAGRSPATLLAVLGDLLDDVLDSTDEPRVCLIHSRPVAADIWLAPDGELTLTGWRHAGLGDPHVDLAYAAASVHDRFGPAVVAPMLDGYGIDRIDLRRLDAAQLLAHLLG